jgi:glycosyltransferase involved in cell wall biosynthesis
MSAGGRPDLSVVVPVYGCEGCLEELCSRIAATITRLTKTFEIILVCDGSPDRSWVRIRELALHDSRIKGIRLTRNYGQHYAISAGIEHACGQWIVVMDCDLQDIPEEIAALYQKANEGYDLVFAQRVGRQDTWLKRFLSKAFYRVLSYLTGTRYDASTANFGIFSSRAVAEVNAMPERSRFFPLMVRWAGYRITLLPVTHAPRRSGNSAYNLRKSIRLALEIVLSYSDKPLRLLAKLGLLFSAAAFLLVLFSLYRYLDGAVAVAGYTSIIASIWLLGGIVICGVGVVGLYVGRVFNDIKGRPYYAVDEYLNFADRSPRHG